MTEKENFKRLGKRSDRTFSRQILLRWAKELALIRKLMKAHLKDLEGKSFDSMVGG
jgi:hypothetical protein